ncbi:unnamed protein product [Symbiodinium necroappetens]|uniref:Uncharacterized protein n=1 Tax=Symbiodinium necroappetens TaxID=1628268 RepID=A0A813A1X8_9DINO|nr:unnamed protein product [Symbiodinium necroappetens]
MEQREAELLELQEKAKTRRRNLAKEAVKSQASVPSESSGSSDESEKKVEKEAEKAEEHKATEKPEEPKEQAEKAEEAKEVEKPEESKDLETKVREGGEEFDISLAEACREAYHMTDNAIESLLEDERKDAIRAVLQVLEGDIEELPRGYGSHLERLVDSFERWNVELRETSDSTECELEEHIEKSDRAKVAKEDLLARKADAQRRKIEAEQDIAAAEKDIEENKKIIEDLETDGAKLRDGRTAVRETHQVAGRALQMLQGIVKKLRAATSTDDELRKNLFQDEGKKGSAQLQMLRMLMRKRKSGTETPRNAKTPKSMQSEDECRSQSQGKRARGSDRPNELENPPKTPRLLQAKAKTAPDILKEKDVQPEKRDRKRELENVPDKWLNKPRSHREHKEGSGFTITDDNGKKRVAAGWGSHTIQKCRLNTSRIDPSTPEKPTKPERTNVKRAKEAQPIDLEEEEKEMLQKGSASESSKPNIFTTPDGKVRPNPKWGEERPRVEEKKRPKPKESKETEKKEKKEHKEMKHKKEKKEKDRRAESPEKGYSEKDMADTS